MAKKHFLTQHVKAAYFFPKYAPKVIDWQHKLTGRNARGNPSTFTPEDYQYILDGVHRMHVDLHKKISKEIK